MNMRDDLKNELDIKILEFNIKLIAILLFKAKI